MTEKRFPETVEWTAKLEQAQAKVAYYTTRILSR
jgi:hypothetical protein